LKKCEECGEKSPVRTGFCVVCGSKLELAAENRRARRLFFLTPFFIVAFFSAFFTEFSDSASLTAGIVIGANFAVLYLMAGFTFWLVAKIAKISVAPDNKWKVGLFAISQLILTGLLATILEDKFLQSSKEAFAINDYMTLRWEIMALILIPALFTAYFTLYARKTKFRLEKEVKGSKFQNLLRFSFFNSLLIMVGLTTFVSVSVFFLNSPQRRLLIMAKIYSETGAIKKSEQLIERAISMGTPEPELLFFKSGLDLAKYPKDNSRMDSALNCLQLALEKEPENTLYLFRLSAAYELSGNLEKAIEIASKAASLRESDDILWQTLGDLQLKAQNFEEAVKSYKTALKNFPDNPNLLNNLAYTLLDQGKELPLALELARKSVKLRPGVVFNLDTLAWALYKNGRLNEALEILGQIFQGRKEVSPEVDFHYAVILYEFKMLQEPAQAFRKMLAKPEVINDYNLFKQIKDMLKKVEEEIQQQNNLKDTKEKEKG
jgi:tetratricopeptide (TPR) repeat protein